MFSFLAGSGSDEASWPKQQVVSALKKRFGDVDKLAEDGPLSVYGVADHGVNFVVALMQTAEGSGDVAELGFLARFVDFGATAGMVEAINRNLHISVASIEQGDLFLMAGMEVIGAFDEAQFNLILEQWRRDLTVCIHELTGADASLADAFPAAKLEAARNFAVNRAPSVDSGNGQTSAEIDFLSSFLGKGRADRMMCGDCEGRGKRGLIKRTCEACDGSGFVARTGR